MARLRFKKPKIAILMSEVISLSVWLYLGDQIIDVLDNLIGREGIFNLSTSASLTTVEGCTNGTVFADAYEILGLGFDCSASANNGTDGTTDFANVDDGLLGVVGLVMVVMVLMNFVSYN